MSDHSYGQVTMTAQQYAELAQKAAAHDATEAQAQQQAPDVELEDGEAEVSEERRALMQGAERPGEQAPADPYQEADRVHDDLIAAGAPQKVALGGMINSIVNAAHRGDQRVILNRDGTTPRDRDNYWGE